MIDLDLSICKFQRSLSVLGPQLSTIKKGIASLNSVMTRFEAVISDAEEAANDLKALPPFEADYQQFHWVTKYENFDNLIENLAPKEKNDYIVNISSLFEEEDLEFQDKDISYRRACNVIKKYRIRDEYSSYISETSFLHEYTAKNSTMLDKHESWKEELFGMSYIVNERFGLKRRCRGLEPVKINERTHFVELVFNFGEISQSTNYISNMLDNQEVLIEEDSFIEFSQLFEENSQFTHNLEVSDHPKHDFLYLEDNYEDIDNNFCFIEEKPYREEILELPSNLAEFSFNFEEDSIQENPENFEDVPLNDLIFKNDDFSPVIRRAKKTSSQR